MIDLPKRDETNSSNMIANPFEDKDEESKSFISASEDIWNNQNYKTWLTVLNTKWFLGRKDNIWLFKSFIQILGIIIFYHRII